MERLVARDRGDLATPSTPLEAAFLEISNIDKLSINHYDAVLCEKHTRNGHQRNCSSRPHISKKIVCYTLHHLSKKHNAPKLKQQNWRQQSPWMPNSNTKKIWQCRLHMRTDGRIKKGRQRQLRPWNNYISNQPILGVFKSLPDWSGFAHSHACNFSPVVALTG